MHRHVYVPFSNSYSLVNYLHDIKLNRSNLSDLRSPHISSAMPFVVDNVHTGRSLGADVGVRHALMALNEQLSEHATLGLARMKLLPNYRLGLFRRESQVEVGRDAASTELFVRARCSQSRTYHFTPHSLKRFLDGILALRRMLAGMPPTFWGLTTSMRTTLRS